MGGIQMELKQNQFAFHVGRGIKSWWWVAMFAALSAMLYTQGAYRKQQAITEIRSRIFDLETKKSYYLEEKESLEMQITSQSDPEWIELTLKKGLGLVPEGQRKIYFLK